jgi:hypothetical protein
LPIRSPVRCGWLCAHFRRVYTPLNKHGWNQL